MRLDYYSGADTFIINTTGASYEIVPVIDTLTCLQVCAVCVVCGVRCVQCVLLMRIYTVGVRRSTNTDANHTGGVLTLTLFTQEEY
jgi:hypothetical protein